MDSSNGERNRPRWHARRYAACTLTNWGTYEHDGDAAAPMAGLVTMWLNIGAQWALFLLYEWTLVAPLLFPGRDFA